MFRKKWLRIVITICIVLLMGVCIQRIKSDLSTAMTEDRILPQSGDFNSAWFVVDDMHAGWNLGNTLENTSSDNYEVGIQKRGEYTCFASYSPQKYDVWNESPSASFSKDKGTAVISWDLSLIKSPPDSPYGSFGVQIFNWSIGNTGDSQLVVKITKATITMSDGSKKELNELLGEHSLQLVEGVAKLYPEMSQVVSKTGELSGGNLRIEMMIKEYLNPVNPVSKEVYFETLLNNPVTTQEMIDEVADAGFGAIRIPITFSDHMDTKTGLIDEAWLNRIEEVVGYAYENKLYCIINIHHDTGANGWLKASPNSYDENNPMFVSIWKQVATRFVDYDNQLIFEGFNEILDEESSWSNPDKEAYAIVNKLNQDFVDTIRKTGGNNANRCLVVNTYGAMTSEAVVSQFVLPTDSTNQKLIVQVHMYAQQDFAWQQEEVNWATSRDTWGTKTDQKQLDESLSRLYQYFISAGVPVIVGEFGAWNKSNLDERVEYTAYYVSKAKEYGVVCFWWDVGGNSKTADEVKSAALLNRKKLEWYFPELVEVLTAN